MRRSANEVIRNLEQRIARLEKSAGRTRSEFLYQLFFEEINGTRRLKNLKFVSAEKSGFFHFKQGVVNLTGSVDVDRNKISIGVWDDKMAMDASFELSFSDYLKIINNLDVFDIESFEKDILKVFGQILKKHTGLLMHFYVTSNEYV
tara:strand:+ start:164 stop:604 length:441 start_codon:yes stop_codon:yes gene_type:complete